MKKDIPLALLNLYFDQIGEKINEENRWDEIAGDNTNLAIVNWLNDLVQVGWQLCHNSNI